MISAANTAPSSITAASQAFDQEAAKIARASKIAVEQVTRKSLADAPRKDDDVRSVIATSQPETNYNSSARIAREITAAIGKVLDLLT
ncbi:MAG: hypothetical protein JJ939_01730 [Alphaproteobacteria bacterium]|jgi:hypothetical protein|nr:hypothetical protein [Rhodobiaceae bacterium]MBO6542950.1 hypothetical protein [Alphaproteobacteria bacterium]MBO6627123.1 hypothetical protein [Alphaproteobacteria bacterium]MDF1626386.1 hypothetical protein [Parvibaculaceae bacterium]|tara:strand:- start:144 stop:407 length:264 start_codon:yes stop_codon:yes gene_type:complete